MHTNLQISHWFIRWFRFDVIFNIKNKRKQRFLVDSKACYTRPIQHDFIEIYLFDSLIRLNLLCDWAWTARLFWTNECLILIFFSFAPVRPVNLVTVDSMWQIQTTWLPKRRRTNFCKKRWRPHSRISRICKTFPACAPVNVFHI